MEPSKLNQLKKILDNEVLMKRETAHGETEVCYNSSLTCVYTALNSHRSVKVFVFAPEPWMGLMEAVLRSLEGVLCRMNGEVWQQQDSTATNSHRDTRESGLHTGYTQVTYFSPLKQHRATDYQ